MLLSEQSVHAVLPTMRCEGEEHHTVALEQQTPAVGRCVGQITKTIVLTNANLGYMNPLNSILFIDLLYNTIIFWSLIHCIKFLYSNRKQEIEPLMGPLLLKSDFRYSI